MKTELDKCMAGEWYDCHDPIFITQKGKTRQLLARYNALPYEEKKTKQEVLKEMFGSIGNNVSVGTPFLCDYGCNIHIGDNVSVNMNCSFIDCNKITIGSHVLIASNVQIYTATHRVVRTAHSRLDSGSSCLFLPYLCTSCDYRRRLLDRWRCDHITRSDYRQRVCNRSRKCRNQKYSGR